MVSLAPSKGDGHGGFFFGYTSDRESARSEDIDLLNESGHMSPVVNRGQFIPLTRTSIPWIAGFEVFLLVAFEILCFVLTDALSVKEFDGDYPSLSFLCSLHVLLWFVVVVLNLFLVHQHNQLQLHGYLTFTYQTKNLRSVPAFVLSFGNAVLLGFFSIINKVWDKSVFPFYRFFQLMYSLEFVIVLPALIYYIVKVVSFNRERPLPDCYAVANNDVRLDVEGEIGYSDSGWPHGVLEKQADMIRYLQQHNENLSRRLLRQVEGT